MQDDSLSVDIEKADLFIEGNADTVKQGILKNPNAYVKLGSLQDQQNFAIYITYLLNNKLMLLLNLRLI